SKNNPEDEGIIEIFIKEANEDMANPQIKTALETFIRNYRKARNISTGNLLNFLYQNNKRIRSRKQIPVQAASLQRRTKRLTKGKKRAFPGRQPLNELENADPQEMQA
ncbi:10176_t:CDS:1, partial [Racocetra persica]